MDCQYWVVMNQIWTVNHDLELNLGGRCSGNLRFFVGTTDGFPGSTPPITVGRSRCDGIAVKATYCIFGASNG